MATLKPDGRCSSRRTCYPQSHARVHGDAPAFSYLGRGREGRLLRPFVILAAAARSPGNAGCCVSPGWLGATLPAVAAGHRVRVGRVHPVDRPPAARFRHCTDEVTPSSRTDSPSLPAAAGAGIRDRNRLGSHSVRRARHRRDWDRAFPSGHRPAVEKTTKQGRARWTTRWKPALNAFTITFGDRFPAAETY
jgi:hypothetical protein